MINLFKKYGLFIVVMLVIALLLFIIIPYQEQAYLEPEIDTIRKKARLALLWTMLGLGIIIIFFLLKKCTNSNELLYSLLNLSLLSLSFFLTFQSVFLSAAYFINTLSSNKTIEQQYKVIFIDDDEKSLQLWDDHLHKTIDSDKINLNNSDFKVNDTITLSFNQGLLGFKFNPELKADF